jgi:transposase InsO family protein
VIHFGIFVAKKTMPADVHHLRYLFPKLHRKSYRMLMKTIQNSLALEHSDVAGFRLHVLNHYYKHGLRSALDAFNVKKSTLYDWRKVYEQSRERVVSLVPKSTAPLHVRRMETDWRLIEFIRGMRKEYGNIGKNIIKPFLDTYAKKTGIKTISLTTIGKVIKRRHLTFEEHLHIKRQFKFKKLRTRKSPKVTKPGFIQMDSIIVHINYERHLFMSIMDIYTKFALVEYVSSLSSATAKEVMEKFRKTNPTPISIVQTDNGSEFLGVFHEHVENQNIKHQFIYPRLVRVNSFIERFNRTIQEEFILRNDEIYYDIPGFKDKLTKYLTWYNYQRPHTSLKYVSPIEFIKTKIPKSG